MTPATAARKSFRRWMIALFASVALTIIPPIVGLLGTVTGMLNAFETLGAERGEEPAVLARQISVALNSTAAGLVVSSVGAIALVISVIGIILARRRCEQAADRDPE